jgi:hypothetical protein
MSEDNLRTSLFACLLDYEKGFFEEVDLDDDVHEHFPAFKFYRPKEGGVDCFATMFATHDDRVALDSYKGGEDQDVYDSGDDSTTAESSVKSYEDHKDEYGDGSCVDEPQAWQDMEEKMLSLVQSNEDLTFALTCARHVTREKDEEIRALKGQLKDAVQKRHIVSRGIAPQPSMPPDLPIVSHQLVEILAQALPHCGHHAEQHSPLAMSGFATGESTLASKTGTTKVRRAEFDAHTGADNSRGPRGPTGPLVTP